MPKHSGNKKISPAKKTPAKKTSPSKKQVKSKEAPAEDRNESEEVEVSALESYRTPGERMREVTGEELSNWPKTSNCKFYIDIAHKQTDYELEDEESDKVCVHPHIANGVTTYCQRSKMTADGMSYRWR